MVPVERIELPTFGLQNRCSTAELNRRIEAIGARRKYPPRGADLRRLEYQTWSQRARTSRTAFIASAWKRRLSSRLFQTRFAIVLLAEMLPAVLAAEPGAGDRQNRCGGHRLRRPSGRWRWRRRLRRRRRRPRHRPARSRCYRPSGCSCRARCGPAAPRWLRSPRCQVDAGRLAAIGFWSVVLELAREGAELKAVVSFHGMLATKMPAQPGQVKASVLVCTGVDDPLAPPE